jgi:indolepyruvate ferredoxin oxidoreductase alpha subunit
MDILSSKGKAILLGNEAIVRGALEANVKFASTYPGTPASEIGDTFAKIAKQAGIYFEYSINEKVALEAAAGAAFSGLRALVSFKHFGLNVASDSLFPIAYVGTKAGLVIVCADDPSCWSSAQSEQDTRFYSLMAHIPMLEPSDPQECKDFTKFAFELSEKFEIPVLIRLTTRVSLSSGVVKLGKIESKEIKAKFEKDLKRFDTLPPHTMEMHEKILQKIEEIRKISERTRLNFILNKNSKSNFGIIASGVSFNYVVEALDDLDLKVPVFKLGLTHPLPTKKLGNFIKKFDSVLIVEELEPIIEKEVKELAKEFNPKLRIYGKNVLPKSGEYREEMILKVLEKMSGKKFKKINLKKHEEEARKIKIAKRFPLLCPGCPHRATFYAVKKAAGKDAIFGGDIGCYILGIYPPLYTQDFCISMGANFGIIHGIKKATNQKAICFIGDSTFFHAGMPGLVNMVFNKSNPLVIILDNRYTAMTGHQPHPGTGYTGMNEKTMEIKIEDVVKSFGVKNVKVVDPFNLAEMERSVREFLEKEELSVIVARRECQLMAVRRMKKEGAKIPKYEINEEKCIKCKTCLKEFGCPAIQEKNGKIYIDETICTGCGVCAQVCPVKAIQVKK